MRLSSSSNLITIAATRLDILSNNTVHFRDSAIYAYSSADGWLNLVADVGVEINAPILNVGSLYSAGDIDCDTDITAVGAVTGSNLSGTNTGDEPIGSIIAWHKSFPNTPALSAAWVECNGQTLSDAASPYNGQVIPNLNGAAAGADLSNGDNLGKTGEVFLKGDETSGTTQFDTFQGHNHDVNVYAHPAGATIFDYTEAGTAGNPTTVAGATEFKAGSPTTDGVNGTPRTASTTKPRNMTVVWIMKIK